MTAAIKMAYGEVMVEEKNDAPLYITENDLHNWYLASELREGYMMSESAHKAALSLVKK